MLKLHNSNLVYLSIRNHAFTLNYLIRFQSYRPTLIKAGMENDSLNVSCLPIKSCYMIVDNVIL